MTQPANQAKDFASMFNRHFKSLTGNPSLLWQERLFSDHFVKNDIPAVIDIPTGLGKTMVMAIWLIARAVNNKLKHSIYH